MQSPILLALIADRRERKVRNRKSDNDMKIRLSSTNAKFKFIVLALNLLFDTEQRSLSFFYALSKLT